MLVSGSTERIVVTNGVSEAEMTEAQDNPITPSDEDFDDGLDFPHQVTIISVEGEPVAVERNDEGDGLASGDYYLHTTGSILPNLFNSNF